MPKPPPSRNSQQKIKLPASAVCQRYGVVDRTLDRWLKNRELAFPKPLYINHRRYFDEAELEIWERKQAARKAA
jgi:predicted DNA-binding transcriptional regulator AlpA